MSNIQLSEEAIERVFKRDGAAGCAKMESVFDHMYQDRTDKSTLELVGELRASFPTGAADLGNSPLSITEIPQLIAGVGCR